MFLEMKRKFYIWFLVGRVFDREGNSVLNWSFLYFADEVGRLRSGGWVVEVIVFFFWRKDFCGAGRFGVFFFWRLGGRRGEFVVILFCEGVVVI